MSDEDGFQPRLGRLRGRGRGRAKVRSYLGRVLAAVHLAAGGAGGAARRSAFTGARIGRGSGVGRVLAARDRYAAFRRRRVIVKSRIVRLAGKGASAAAAHLRYVQRDGVTREGAPGQLYDAAGEAVDGKAFLARGKGDHHQFRFIVSAEDGADYDDLKPLVRRLMTRMEADLGTSLDWVAVDHFNTGHPHSHVLLRGIDDRGRDLIIARDYITTGMRERAAELVELDLGPRTDRMIEDRLRAEIDQERVTSIDRRLVRDGGVARLVVTADPDPFQQALRAGRLAKLGRLGLADDLGGGRWRLADTVEDTLRQMGERGDIIRTMQRAFSARGLSPAPADQAIYDPAAPGARALVGRVLERGLADEHDDRHYLLVEATDGRSHYVDIGKPSKNAGDRFAVGDAPARGTVVRIEPAATGIRGADRTIAAVAADNGGLYDVDAHLRHDPSATESFAETHVRRLEAMRRLTGAVERHADGSWEIAPDHLARVEAFEQARARNRPVAVTMLSGGRLDLLATMDAPTWLDRELVAARPEPLRDAGFGREVRVAQARRRQWLVEQGLAEQDDGLIRYRAGLLALLQRRELLRVAGQLAPELGLPFVEAETGARVEGVLRRPVELGGGRYALIEKSKEFTLLPWRPVLERQVGKQVAGIVREGGVSWSFGRSRDGPSIG